MPTKIEWAKESWNPLTGCTPVSEGCEHCYARRMAQRLRGRYGYPKDDPFRVTFHPDKVERPLKWKKPRRVFVCSMSDLFHPDVDWLIIDNILNTCWRAPRHIFLILTKRIEAAWYYFRSPIFFTPDLHRREFLERGNIWLGVSAENQKRANERIPILFEIPAAKHFVSIEPMLGPINLNGLEHGSIFFSALERGLFYPEKLDWVICGGESGPGARPMHPNWPRSIRDQCQDAQVPFFFKQHGEYVWEGDCIIEDYETYLSYHFGDDERGGIFCIKIGKKKAGRLLDGREWNEVPEIDNAIL